MRIALAVGDEEIRGCYPVMAGPGPHVAPEELVPKVRMQTEEGGYRLAYLSDGG